MLHRPNNRIQHHLQPRPHNRLITTIRNRRIRHEILHPDRRARAILANLIIAVGEDAGRKTVIEYSIVVVFFVAAVAVAAAVAEVVFECYVCWGGGLGGGGSGGRGLG